MVTQVQAEAATESIEGTDRTAAWAELMRSAAAFYGRVAAERGEGVAPLDEDELLATAQLAAALEAPLAVASARFARRKRRCGALAGARN